MSGRRRGFPIGELILLVLLLIASKEWKWLAILLVIPAVVLLPGWVSNYLDARRFRDVFREQACGQDLVTSPVPQPQPITDQPIGWDYSPKRYFFTKSEAAFFHGVREVIPTDHHVFPKVRLSDLLDIKSSGRAYKYSFHRVSQKHIDFVLCDPSFRSYLAIEIDGRSHRQWRQQESDETKDRVLEVSGLPIIRYQVGTNWDFGRIATYVP